MSTSTGLGAWSPLMLSSFSGRSASDDDTTPSSPSSSDLPTSFYTPWAGDCWPTAHAEGATDVSCTLDDGTRRPAGCEPDAIKLFVGNIPKSCTEQQLLPLFESVGHVVELMIMRERDASKGSAFLWYPTRALAELAIQKFHLRFILNDPVGENNRRLVLRKAWDKGESNRCIHRGGADGVPCGTAQILYLSLGPTTPTATAAPASFKPPTAHQFYQPSAVPSQVFLAQGMTQFNAPSYQGPRSLGPHAPWPQQPAPAPQPDPASPRATATRAGHLHAGGAPKYPGSLQMPLNASLVSSCPQPPLFQLPHAGTSGRCGSRPASTAYPASLTSPATRTSQLAPAAKSAAAGYAELIEQPAGAAYHVGQMSHQLELLDVAQRGAGAGPHPQFFGKAVAGVHGLHGARVEGANQARRRSSATQYQGLAGMQADIVDEASDGTVSSTQLLDLQQLRSLIEYLHTVQGMCGAEVELSMPPICGCFQLKISGSQAQVQAGEVIINSLLMGSPAPFIM